MLSHGWLLLEQGLDAFQSAAELQEVLRQLQQDDPDTDLADLGLIIGGDLALLHERMAMASTRMPRVQSDESTMIMSFITAMVEARNAKGSGWSVGSRLADFTGQSAATAARPGHRRPGRTADSLR